MFDEMLEKLFPDAVRLEPGPDGSCPLCKEMGVDLEEVTEADDDFLLMTSSWPPRRRN